MKDVGYTRFDLGLPGNLIPVRREDYLVLVKAVGGPEKADGSDAFQIYENGGATACFAYFTIQALRNLGRDGEADAILFPMLKAFEDGGFQGSDALGHTYDWKGWDAYILVAIQLEVRDLLRFHGEAYAYYRQQVSMILPAPLRRSGGVGEAKPAAGTGQKG
jgi:hypothetical protein